MVTDLIAVIYLQKESHNIPFWNEQGGWGKQNIMKINAKYFHFK